jgi:hypothetical protein
MIVKNLTRKSGTNQLLRYIFKYISQEEKVGLDQEQFVIRHNVHGHDINSFITAFKENESKRLYRRIDQTTVHHTILSWSNKDKDHVTPAMLKDIARKYIQIRGENNLYVGTIHNDREHTHLHLAMSGSQISGRSSRISQQEFADLKTTLDAYQREKYPQLTNSLPEHGRAKALKEKGISVDRQNGRTTQKEQLLQAIGEAHRTANSQETFLDALRTQGYEPYYRGDKLTGIQLDNGRKFRFSSLGYDAEKLKELSCRKSSETKSLDELEQLRAFGKEQERQFIDPDIQLTEDVAIEFGANELDELEFLRHQDEERDLEFETDPLSYGYDDDSDLDAQDIADELGALRSGSSKGARGKAPTR